MNQKTIAIYGGSFDPPHMGHQMACLYLLEALGVEAVWLLPSFVHPLGKNMTSFTHRLAMCECLALPFAGKVVVSPLEKTLGGQGRTFDLITYLQKTYPHQNFSLVIGADILTQKQAWYRFDEIEKMLPLIVIGREGYKGGEITLPNISSTAMREGLKSKQSVKGLLPLSVYDYVLEHGLY